MTDKEKELIVYCLKANSDFHGEVCEECKNFPKCDHFQADSLMEKLIEALEQDPNKWIPVSERLPEDNELVLFSTKTDRVFEGRFFSDNTDRQWYSFCDRTFAWNNVVIAWMPLPEPYEPQESEVNNAK